MRTRFSRVVVLAGFLLGIGCSNGPACVIDTDCPLGQACGSDQHCQPLGGTDSGPTPDAGGADSGGGDSGGSDSGAVDAAVDAGGEDSGAIECISTPGTFVLSASPAACPTIIAGFTVVAGASACDIVISSREKGTFGGTLTSTDGATFDGTLSIGDTSYPDCALTFGRDGTSATIDCGGGCTLAGTLP